MVDEEPDAGLGNGGLGRLAACTSTPWRRCSFRRWITDCATSTACSGRIFATDGGRPDDSLRKADPWEIARHGETVEVKFDCSFELRDGNLRLIPHAPSTLIGMPYDRPVIGYGGDADDTFGCGAPRRPMHSTIQQFSHGDVVASIAEESSAQKP